MGINQSTEAAAIIDIPSHARLRLMASDLKRDQLASLEIYRPLPSAMPPATELLLQFQQARGVTRDRIWTMAMGDEFHRPPAQSNAHVDFRYFQRLPFEIRENIWIETLESNRLLEIVWENGGSRWSATQSSQKGYPSLMHTCYESRRVAEKRMFFCFGTWINVYSDLLWINGKGTNLWAKALLFATALFEACLAVYINENSPRVTIGHRLMKIAISSDLGKESLMWETGQKSDQPPGVPLFGASKGALRILLPWVNDVVLIAEEEVLSRPGVSYRDERLLTQDDLLGLSFAATTTRTAANDLEERIRDSMATDLRGGKSFGVSAKLLITCPTAIRP